MNEMANNQTNIEAKKYKKIWFNLAIIIILAAIIIFTIWIRTQNISQLKDVTTGHYTLGPDLDPFLYLRHAREIVSGTLKEPDMMRAAPLGSDNYAKTNLMPWAMVYLYRFLDIFFDYPIASIEFAAIILPVICFALTLIVFFFFIMKLFSFITTKTNSIIIALIATAFYAVIPEMLHRTMAGIPEIESLGMLWFWLAFLCFISAWQSDKLKKLIPLALLSGIFTGLMIFTWGGFRYIFMTFVLASFLAFFFEKQKKKNFLIYVLWLVPSLIFAFAKGGVGMLTVMTDTGLSLAFLSVLILDMAIFNTNCKKIKEKIKLPESIISLIITFIVGFLFILIIKPTFLPEIFSKIVEGLLYPFGRGRIGLTVAENRAPYFTEVFSSFGLLFWVFFFGTLFLFYEATKHFDIKNKVLLNIFFIIFMITFIFSRISPQSLLNGESFFSRLIYFGGFLLFVIVLVTIYIKASRKKDVKTLEDFKEINFSYILILAFIFWMIVSMRGAIRLFFIISPALIMAASFLPIKVAEIILKTKDDLYKILLWCAIIIITFLLVFSFINYAKISVQQAKYTVPGAYYQQWQKAMAWVRENTPENAIFAHWWDYGYWVQTLGNRATILDGGHAMHNGFWNHLMGRYVLCGQNEQEALEFLYAHNTSYFLIDSTDIGKYPAYSSIGSDETGTDRLSWISLFVLDEKQIQESKNETAYVYVGGTMLDQDIIWQGQLFPANKAGIVGFIMVVDKEKSTINEIKAVIIYNKQQFRVPIKYVYLNNKLHKILEDDDAINGTLYIVPRLTQRGMNNLGAALYLSEKLMRSQMVKLYLLNETENFELVHSEDALFIKQLREVYNISVGDFLVINEIVGPIKIFKVNYPENFTIEETKLKRYLQFKSDLPFALW
ncbi:MAG: STT3 domain-containing protein [Candidatus Pacearchaeota archaeon]